MAAAWVTLTDWPATVNVPVRDAGVGLALTLNVNVPPPDPPAPTGMGIQLVSLVAVQAHPLPVVSEKELAPADEAIDCDVADSEYVHAVAPDCVTAKV